MIPLPGASGSNKSRKITREGSFSIWAKDETYFPPQKIFVVITKLERLEKEKKKKSKQTSVTTSAKQTC